MGWSGAFAFDTLEYIAISATPALQWLPCVRPLEYELYRKLSAKGVAVRIDLIISNSSSNTNNPAENAFQ